MIVYYVSSGESIYSAAQNAIAYAKKHKVNEVEFEFNEINLRVSPLSFPDDIVYIYSLKCEIRRLQK